MKNKKIFISKVLFLFLCLVFALVLVSCGNQNGENTPNDGESTEGDPGNENDPGNNNDPEPQDEITYLTVSEAYDIAVKAGDKGTEERKYVKGTVQEITNSTYGEMYITDGVKSLYVYGVYSSDGEKRYVDLEEKPYSGDEVYLYGVLKTYKDSPELGASWLQKFESHQGEIDLTEYEEMTVAEARSADLNKKIIINGVVGAVTYANGMKPNGIFVIDNTGSIYVYSLEVASRVEVGNTIKVAGTKTLYILDSEKENAKTFGYQGSIQLQDAVFISASSDKKDFNKEWIEDSSVKEMLETPLTNNITTKIFKVNAIINKVPGSGFVNYYINDLDNKTGSYCYTLCNGGDFSYLDQYDGKICTVYLTALNCKATKATTIYRFVPIQVEENTSFTMTDEEIAKFAIDYYAKKQFLEEYNSDPELQLIMRVSNDYIPFKDVALSYTSNSELITIDDHEDTLHIEGGNSEVTITITATYNGATVSEDYKFLVNSKSIPDTISIKAAIESDDNTTVTVRGIVMSGTVNQTGFYLNDGTGVIAVRTDAETLSKIALGNDIVITGLKTHIVKEGMTMIGQACIDNATLEVNLLGNNQYSTDPFITNLTFDDVMELISSDEDLTTNVYVVKCHLKIVETQYYKNFYLTNADKSKDIYLYAGSGNQYSIYNDFVDNGEYTITFMLCNWNSKTPYRACIISVNDGKKEVINNYNFR